MEGPNGVHLKNRKAQCGCSVEINNFRIIYYRNFNLQVRMRFLEIKYRMKSALNPGNVGSFCKERLEGEKTEPGMGVINRGQGLKK